MHEQKDTPLHIPQGPPFVMIDKLLYADEVSARTSFVVRADNVLIDGEFFCEAGLVENMAQTAAAQAGHISSLEKKMPAIGYIADVKNLEIVFLPKINDEIETEIHIENQIFGVTIIGAKVFCRQKLVASCQMKIFITQIK